MPRPGHAARKNHHGNRHENGLVVPGKKVTKQKSNGHLNGNLGLGHQANLPSHPSSNNDSNNLPGQESMPTVRDMKLNGAAEVSKLEANGRAHANGYGGMPNGSPCSSAVTNGVIPGIKMDEQKPLRTDKSGGAAPALKKSPSTSVNPFQLASTILKSCPMYDTIAILIFLLQLPPIVLTLVQFLFASLTFMPPAGVSTGSLTSNFDIFQGPAGTPSLGTMIAMDGFCLLVWGLFMWTWAQNFAIDLAQVQVAITLGGGSSGKNGGVNAFCVMMVLVVHLLRSSGVQDFVIGHLLSAKIISTDTLSRYSHVFPLDLRRKEPPSPPSWIRSLLAVHILAQAGTAMARRSMAKNRSPPPSKTGKRADTEASAGAQTHLDSSAFDSTTSFSTALGPDGTMISPPTVMKENRERTIGTKKRRRQANQVRSRQPFWAALASTKVTVMREYEHSRNGSWSPFTHPVTEDDVEDASLGGGYIWITHVDSSSIKFAASDFALADDTATNVDTLYDSGCGNAPVEPFYVRVNGAYWATVTLCNIPKDPDAPSLVRWRGEISGLAPDCAYTCSFVRSDTEEEICVMSVKTPHAPDTDQVLSIPSVSPSPRQALRPSSPTTTIKNSIMNAEAKLNERRSRLKKSKNDHKIQISKVKKELDNFNNRLNSGGDESRQKQRSLQLERNIRQTEEATAVIDVQLDSLEKIPEEELEEWNSRKAAFEQEVERTKSAKAALDAAKSAASRDLASTQSELASIVQKRERLQSRRTRLTEQHERITAANNQGLNERERRAAEQLAKEREQARIEEAFHEQITSITASVQDYQIRINQLWQQAAAIEQAFQQQQHQQMLMNAGPLTPEGELPGTNPQPQEAAASPGPSTMNRTHSLLSYPPFSGDKMGISGYRTSMSPISGTPLMASPEPHHRQYPTSPFGPDPSDYRDRSLSNVSGNSMQGDFGGPLYSSELYDVMGDASRRPPSGVANFASSINPVNRAGSRNSGSGSGSGSGGGSGSASPHSFRGKSVWS